jgi:hypothetical protein
VTRIQKVLFGVIGLGIALGIVAGGTTMWIGRRTGRAFMKSVHAAHEQGRLEGARLDESACLAAAFQRLRADPSMTFAASLRDNQRLVGCLEASRLSEHACQGVPSMATPLRVGVWAGEHCQAIGLPGVYCHNVLMRLAEHCSSPKRAARPPIPAGGA